jgi:hypothetical protein
LKKNTLKYLIDAALFVDMSSMAVLGFLLAFVIPRGRTHAVSVYFLGLHRHQWADIHLFLSLFLVLLLFFHIWFNWTWVVQSSKRYIGDRWKTFLWALCAGCIAVLFVGWISVRF